MEQKRKKKPVLIKTEKGKKQPILVLLTSQKGGAHGQWFGWGQLQWWRPPGGPKQTATFLKNDYYCSQFFFNIYLTVLDPSIFNLRCGMRTPGCSMKDLVPWPGIKSGSPALEEQDLNHCTTPGKTTQLDVFKAYLGGLPWWSCG